MSRYRGPKNRIARRFGCNIFGKLRDPLAHKPHPPGVQRPRRSKKSDYGLQLEEKQKLKAFYGLISEKQLVSYYRKSQKQKGVVAEHLVAYLECRLDVVIYRMKFARTIFSAQQLVSHRHILVNGQIVDRRSFQVKPGDVISVKEQSRQIQPIVQGTGLAIRDVPEYYEVDLDSRSGKMLVIPAIEQVNFPLDIDLAVVCDFLQHAA